jgi:hypothetical protein
MPMPEVCWFAITASSMTARIAHARGANDLAGREGHPRRGTLRSL